MSEVQQPTGGYDPAQDDALKTLGLAVITGQGVEQLLSVCLTYILRDKPIASIAELDGLLKRKATLGQLLRALHEKVDLHPTFDARFAQFLEARNIVAHRLHDVPGGLDLHTDDGRSRLKAFLLRYLDDGSMLSIVLIGLIRDWSLQTGIELPMRNTAHWAPHLDENVIPYLGELMRHKGDDEA